MNPENNLRAMIKRHEGLKLHSYRCSEEKLTIGYGHNLEAHGEADPGTITMQQAEKYLDEDIAEARKQCESIIGWDELGDVRRAVLIDMCFQMGLGGIKGFHRMLHWIAKGYYQQAALEMADSLWFREQTPIRATELIIMMKTGEWQ
jgi:lysozyme